MKILFASPEAVPFAKTGGLADVAGALPKALAQTGHEVNLILPKYRGIDERRFPVSPAGMVLKVPISQKVISGEVYALELAPHFRALLLRQDAYYDRDQMYGTPSGDFEDNAERFIFFSRAVAEAALELTPDIIHCHDWQTGLTPVYLKTLYRWSPLLARAASILTVHNIGYQGLFWHYDMHLTNLGVGVFQPQGPRVLRKAEPPQSGDRLCRRGDHGEPQIHGRNPDSRIREGSGRGLAGPQGGPLRNLERGGLRGMVARRGSLHQREI